MLPKRKMDKKEKKGCSGHYSSQVGPSAGGGGGEGGIGIREKEKGQKTITHGRRCQLSAQRRVEKTLGS